MEFAIGFAAQLVTLAILVEATTEFIKQAIPETVFVPTEIQKQLMSLAVSLIIAFAAGISVFSGEYKILGTLFAALIASRGSNFTHELIGILEFIRESLKRDEQIEDEIEEEIIAVRKMLKAQRAAEVQIARDIVAHQRVME